MLDLLTTNEGRVALLVGGAVFVTVLSIVLPMFGKNDLEKRMKSVALEREQLRSRERQRLLEEKQKNRKGVRRETNATARSIVEKLNLRAALADEKTEQLLLQAGYRGQQPLFTFLVLRFALPFAFMIPAGLYVFTLGSEMEAVQKIGIIAGVGFFGFYAPLFVVKNKFKSRQLSITLAWPDALDLSLICVESGMSIENAFRKVASEIGASSMPLAEEMMLTVAELSYLQDRRSAYENLVKRTGLDPIKNVVLALVQAEKYGTPLSDALRVLSKENRDERMAKAEKKAAALPPKLTVPMMLFFMPVLFAIILTPAILRALGSV